VGDGYISVTDNWETDMKSIVIVSKLNTLSGLLLNFHGFYDQ